MSPKYITALILVATSILAYTSVWNDSPIVDEIPHIGAGYSYVVKNDFRLNPEHPPLVKDLAGLALLTLELNQSAFNTRFWKTDINGQWEFGRNLIFNSGNNALLVTRVAKLPMLLFFILSGVLIYLWAKKRYSSRAGLIAVFLFAFSPTVIAHSRFVTTDMGALFGVLLGTYFFLQYLEHKSAKNLWFAGLAFGVAQLTKFSAIIMGPYFVVLALVAALLMHDNWFKNIFKTALGTAGIFAIGFILVVWPVYGIHTLNYPPEKQKNDTINYLGSYGNRTLADPVIWASDKPYIRSLGHYATGLLMVNQRAIGGNTTYFLGEIDKVAWKKYFPIVYFIKEPLAFWGLVVIVLLFLGTRYKPNWYKTSHWFKDHFVEFAMLLWLAIYWYLSIRANLNIGVRHLLPTYGFMFILLSGQLSKILQNAKIKMQNYNSKSKIFNFKLSFLILHFTLYTLFGWYLYENLKVYPYYLTYFNQTAGGPKGGYIYVVDSNVDWGQDAKRLADWTDENNIQKISLDYFGWADAGYYLGNKYVWINAGRYKNAREFLADNPGGGYIAVSKSFYMGSREKAETSYAWLDSYTPVADIGNSIFVWHITR
ncbi:MAG: glycosyltransferase family 39 protein [Candidatus Paceibacterota bacterium]